MKSQGLFATELRRLLEKSSIAKGKNLSDEMIHLTSKSANGLGFGATSMNKVQSNGKLFFPAVEEAIKAATGINVKVSFWGVSPDTGKPSHIYIRRRGKKQNNP